MKGTGCYQQPVLFGFRTFSEVPQEVLARSPAAASAAGLEFVQYCFIALCYNESSGCDPDLAGAHRLKRGLMLGGSYTGAAGSVTGDRSLGE